MKTSFGRLRVLIRFVVLASSVQGQEYTEYEYSTNNGTITITRYIGAGGQVTIPPEIGGLPVTGIGSWAFSQCSSLSCITFPDSLISIGTYAFSGCTSLTAINVNAGHPIYSSVEGVLFNKAATTLIQCPIGKAGTYAAPVGVKYINNRAFSGCVRLTDLTFPSGLIAIGAEAFAECSSLTNISIAEGVTILGNSVFRGCSSLSNIILPNSVITIGTMPFSGCDGLRSVHLPNSLNSISAGLFSWCTNLTSIIIPNSVTSIGNDAFSGCSLASIAVPAGVTSIGARAFSGCGGLTAINVDAANATYSSLEGILFNKQGTALIQCPTGKLGTYTIPEGVINIGDSAFSGCSRLTGVSIPNGINTIGKGAFRGCSGLTGISIPAGVSSIGDETFYECRNLVEIAVPNSVSSIGQSAFSGCMRLVSITIPSGVTNIGDCAFHGCATLETITLPDRLLRIGWGTFSDCTSLTSITIPGSVTNIEYGAFSGCTRLASITIPAGVNSIGGSAFSGCTNLASITIPHGVTDMGDCAFRGCATLETITLPDRLLRIGWGTFSDCTSLTSITIPGSVTNIEHEAFSGCTSLNSVIIPAAVTSIGSGAFVRCANLSNITIPSSVLLIENGAFAACTSLTGIMVDPGNANYKSLDGVLFSKDQSSLLQFPAGRTGDYAIPDGVSNLEQSAFYGCAGLTSVSIPASLINVANLGWAGLGDSAPDWFSSRSCTGLTAIHVDPENPVYSSVDGVLYDRAQTSLLVWPTGRGGNFKIPGGITVIEQGAFYRCGNLTGVTIPESVTKIEWAAFADCPRLNGVWFEGSPPVESPFSGDEQATVYYLAEKAGWRDEYGGRPTAVWVPQVLSSDSSFGVRDNQFGFNISWARGKTVVVEAATSLDNPVWLPVSTNTLADGSFYFAEEANYPSHFYRVRSQ